MQSMSPEQATFLLQGVQIPAWKRESATTKQVLAAVPTSNVDHRPDPASKTGMELVRHIANSDIRFLQTVVQGAFTAGPTLIPDSARTPSEIADWYSQECSRQFDAIAKLTPEQLLKPVDFRGMFTMPAVNYLQMGLHHSIHHRGQLTTYLRAMGGKVPAIYGESFDSAQAKNATA